MGTGFHGGFGNTAGRTGKVTFSRVKYEGSVKVDGVTRDVSRRVYQRNDIDFEFTDPKTGKTNIQLMRSGRPPIGNDGKPIELHHVIQKESGPIVEMRETTHRDYSHQLHGLAGKGESFRNDKLLAKQYANFTKAYWKWRAAEYKGGTK
mgnify:FL=1